MAGAAAGFEGTWWLASKYANACEKEYTEKTETEDEADTNDSGDSHGFSLLRARTDDGFLAILHLLWYNKGMELHVKTCQNCKQNFTIESEDFAFYEKIQVPSPTFCPECRNIRRLAWREDHTLYRDTCKLCGEKTISIHAPDGPYTVYCRDCWISDKWDPLSYGRDYDFNKSFFEQYRELMTVVPQPALTGARLINSEYSHTSLGLKNCYYVFLCYFSEDSQYSNALLFSKNTFDSFITDNSDHAYETIHSNRLYRVRFGYFADECLDSAFLYDCLGCTDCFGCINLRKQKYCLWNQQLSKEEYQKQIVHWDLGSYARLQEVKAKFKELYLSTPRRFAHIINGINVTGDIIRDAKDCQTCFSVLDGVQNCKYLYIAGLNLKDSYDVSGAGDLSELIYETMLATRAQRTKFCAGSSNSSDIDYCNMCPDCSKCFGCVGVQHKKYCILNKQYTKEEYNTLVPKIIQHMNVMPYQDKKERVYKYGEFFPTELSAYAYNESLAFKWYPKTKEEVLAEGWQWRDPEAKHYEITLKPQDLPDHIRDVKDNILEDIIGCEHAGTCNEMCTTAFRINREELAFYRNMNVALPRLCPNCRYIQRLQWRNSFHLYPRHCSKCSRDIETTYAPDKPEIIYCDQCYKAEFL